MSGNKRYFEPAKRQSQKSKHAKTRKMPKIIFAEVLMFSICMHVVHLVKSSPYSAKFIILVNKRK